MLTSYELNKLTYGLKIISSYFFSKNELIIQNYKKVVADESKRCMRLQSRKLPTYMK